MPNVHYFTSIAANYIPKARILARSIKRHDPDARIHVVLCDTVPAGFDLASEPFDELHLVGDLNIPDVERWLFQHQLVEICTGAKGPALWKLLHQPGVEQVYYFDPDMVVFDDLSRLHAQLAGASVVLTPHLVAPESDDRAVRHNEITALKHGVFNLGFVGVRPTADGLAFAAWWRDRLLAWCWDDIPNGLFTDQRWCDLAPALFDGVRVLRDKHYNVATWNLTHRDVKLAEGGKLAIDGAPLVFFHFSGFDSGGQLLMLDAYAPPESPLFELHDWYVREMDKEGQQTLGRVPCTFAQYSNGEPIARAHRRLYRARADLQQRFPRPFDADGDSLLRFLQSRAGEAALFELAEPPAHEPRLAAEVVTQMRDAVAGRVERVLKRVPGLFPVVKRALDKRRR
jgi:hypothetical protein